MFFSPTMIKATAEGGKKGLKVSGYIIVSAILSALVGALNSPELREALAQQPLLLAALPVGILVFNVLIATIEKIIKESKKED